MDRAEFLRDFPKIELHVHLEGSIRPETLLRLAQRHGRTLPADSAEGLREWYRFRDFPHFVEVYVAASECVRTPDDVELIAREFVEGQAEQNVIYSEATYTASTIEKYARIPWPEQREALARAQAYARTLSTEVRFVLDIVRGDSPERAQEVLDWALDGREHGVVCALGLAGEERLGTAVYRDVFRRAREAGVPVAAHAGETEGPASVREALEVTGATRIGHGVRAVEDPRLVAELRDRGVLLEVCPTSNVCLGVFPSLEAHSLPRLLDDGVALTINSDDPPMFDTTLTREWERCMDAFELDEDVAYSLTLNAVNGAFVTDAERRELRERVREDWPE